MDRRNLIRLGVAGLAGGIIAPKLALAGGSSSSMAGGVFYTKDAPGRWSKKAAGHLPVIELDKNANNVAVRIVTGHEMKGYEHYIIKHVLLNRDFEFIDEKMFNPMKDSVPISTFELANYSGRLHALSVCNKHDTWLNFIEV